MPVFLISALCALLLASAAGADGTRPAEPAAHSAALSVVVSPRTVGYRGRITVRGAGWPSRVSVDLLLGPPRSEAYRFARARTGATGRFAVRVRMPAWARPGTYVLLACRRDCRDKAASRSIRVVRTPGFAG